MWGDCNHLHNRRPPDDRFGGVPIGHAGERACTRGRAGPAREWRRLLLDRRLAVLRHVGQLLLAEL